MTSKQADQNLTDIASGRDMRSGTDGGASTKNLAKRGASFDAMCKFKAKFIRNPTVSEREIKFTQTPSAQEFARGADYL